METINKIMQKNPQITKPKDLSKILEAYSDEWIALSENEDRVVGSGKNINEAVKEAKKKGVDTPILTKVPKEYGNYVLGL